MGPGEDSQPQLSQKELELQAQLDEYRQREGVLLGKLDEATREVAKTPKGKIKAAKDGFEVPKGEEGYTHVVETQVNGEVLAEPRVRAYEPHLYDTLISKQHGYQAEIIRRGE
jgi:hypothetical protein